MVVKNVDNISFLLESERSVNKSIIKPSVSVNNEINKFSVCRFGNVINSHGSVLPFWLRLKAENKAIELTDKRMNR